MARVFIDDEKLDNPKDGLRVGIDFQISDIKDISVRENSKTTTIDLPATENNKKQLGFAEDYNAADPIDQTTKPLARIESEGGTNIMRGYAKAQTAETIDKISKYQLKIFGDNGDWRERIKDAKISDLDYSSDNHTLDYATVIASWTVAAARNYVYDLIDRGLFTGKTSASATAGDAVNVEDCYPAISFSSIFDKIFASIGYTVSSAFLSGAVFTKLYLPFLNPVFRQPDNWGDNKKFKAEMVNGIVVSQNYYANIHNPNGDANFYYHDLFITIPFKTIITDPSTLYKYWHSSSYYEYKCLTTCNYKFNLKLTYIFTAVSTGATALFILYKQSAGSNTRVPIQETEIQRSFVSGSGTIDETFTVMLDAGDTISVICNVPAMNNSTGNAQSGHVTIYNNVGGTDSFIELLEMVGPYPISYGQTVSMNSNLPDIGQLEFIAAIKDLFNLYFYPDIEARVISIEPRDQFYSRTAVDWSSKFDDKKPVTIEYLGDNYTKRLRYKFKEDSSDAFLQEWNKLNADSFGSAEVMMKNVFSKDERTDYENNLFAATWMDITPSPLAGLKTVKIPRMWNSITQPPKGTSFAPRILYYDGIKSLSAYDGWILYGRDATTLQELFTGRTDYPRFYFYGEATGEIDLRYDNTDTAHGLFDNYYANTKKIIDDSRLITVNFYLSDVDISKFGSPAIPGQPFGFQIPIYLEIGGNGAYFEIQSIKGYDSDSKESTKVTLIKQVGKAALVTLTATKKKRTLNPLLYNSLSSIQVSRVIQIIDEEVIYTTINGVLVPVISEDSEGNINNVVI